MKLNKSEELISVIVPVYNVEKYLEECLDSILTQTYSNIEIICINDKSTDSSGYICDKYATLDSRIHVIHKKNNEGLSEARNTGIELAQGKYIAFVDADDWIDKNFLKHLYDGISQQDVDIAQCNFIHRVNNIFKIHKNSLSKNIDIITGKKALNRLYSTSYEKVSVMYTIVCNKLYKKKIIANLKFPKGRMYEDQFFTYKCFSRAKKIYVTEEKLYNYRVSNVSITRQNYNIHFQDEIIAHAEQIQYFKNKDNYFFSIVVARIEPLCIMHYKISEFEDNNEAKRNAYRYALKYLICYLKNDLVCRKNKFKMILFILSPSIFIQNDLNINFNVEKI